MSTTPLPSTTDGRATVGGIDWATELEKHQRWLRTVIRCRVEDAHAVDDVMQEVALATLKTPAQPVAPDRTAPWLYRIAVRQAISHRRKRQRNLRLAGASVQEELPSTTDLNPRDWVISKEVQDSVRRAMARLGSQDRQILLLKYTEKWCYRQLAEHLGVGLDAVEYRLMRAKKRLRRQLRKLGTVEAEP